MDLTDISSKLEKVLTPKRFVHSINVMKTSVDLAQAHGMDASKAALAGLLHDCARDIKGEELFDLCRKYGVAVEAIARMQPELLHGALGAELARAVYNVVDEEILSSIRYHTTGCSNMSLLDKIIFLADSIEPGRTFYGVEDLRQATSRDLNEAVLLSLEKTMKHVMSRGGLIHPDTLEARNSLILEKKMK